MLACVCVSSFFLLVELPDKQTERTIFAKKIQQKFICLHLTVTHDDFRLFTVHRLTRGPLSNTESPGVQCAVYFILRNANQYSSDHNE